MFHTADHSLPLTTSNVQQIVQQCEKLRWQLLIIIETFQYGDLDDDVIITVCDSLAGALAGTRWRAALHLRVDPVLRALMIAALCAGGANTMMMVNDGNMGPRKGVEIANLGHLAHSVHVRRLLF